MPRFSTREAYNCDPVSNGVHLCHMTDLLQLLTPFLLDSRGAE